MSTPRAISQEGLLRQAARVALYRTDFPRFAAEQLHIVTKGDSQTESAVAPFILYPFQRVLHERAAAQMARTGWVRQVWLKGRQAGFSTLSQGLVFWRTVLNPNVNSLVVAHDVGTAQTIFTMARRFYDNIEPGLKPMVRYSTRQELVFDNPSDRERASVRGLNSRIVVATARNIHSGAGSTLHCVHLSEAARYPNAIEIESATLQAVPLARGTVVIVESTARPTGHWFREMCDRARTGESHYEFTFVPWNEDPSAFVPLEPGEVIEPTPEEMDLVREHHLAPEQLKWRRLRLSEKRGNVDELNMDYPLTYEEAWITREFSVFPLYQLRTLYSGLCPPKYRAEVTPGGKVLKAHNGDLAVWDEPEATAMYDIGVDVALGVDGGDWSVAQVLKRPHGVQVAEYRAQIEPGEFADVIDGLGRWYNTAQVAVEVNSVGYYTNAQLSQRYPNLYIWRKRDKLKHQLSNFVGWETSGKTKRWLVALAKDRLYRYATADGKHQYPLVRSEGLYKELQTFVQEPGTDEFYAGPGSTDDRVMAWMIALNASHDEYGMVMEPLGAPEAPAVPQAAIGPALMMDEREVAMVRGEAFESDAWDARGWRQ